jgi:hypothetical protein
MARMRALVLISVAGLVACKSHGEAPPPPSTTGSAPAPGGPAAPTTPATPKPLTITWAEDSIQQTFTLGGGGGSGNASGDTKGVKFFFESFLPGSTYEVNGTRGNTDKMLVTVDGLDFLGPVAFDSIEHVDPKLTLKLSLPDGRTGETKVPPLNFRLHVQDIFKEIEHKPITFGQEPADPKPSDSIFYVGGAMSGDIIGKSGTMQQIDFVATQEMQDATGKKTCNGYNGSHPSITINLKPTEVSLWNRRTGDLVEKKTFPPDEECPMMAMTSSDSDAVDSYPPTEKIEAWLKTKIKR